MVRIHRSKWSRGEWNYTGTGLHSSNWGARGSNCVFLQSV